MSESPSHHEDLARHGDVEHSSDRSFGLVFAVAFTAFALWPLLHGDSLRVWAMGVAGAFLLVALVVPSILGPLNRVWTWVGSVLHRVVSPIVLAVLFYGVILPTGLIMRLFGKRTIPREPDPARVTYWAPRDPPGPAPDGMKNQF